LFPWIKMFSSLCCFVLLFSVPLLVSSLYIYISICQFASFSGDPRRDCPIWNFRNGDFFFAGIEMEGKTPPRGLRGGDQERNIRLRGFSESVHCLTFFIFLFLIYLKILGIYFAMHTLWDILVMSFVILCIFCYTLWNVFAIRFCMIISSQMFLCCFLLWMY
jgi:hypothetical protein